MDNNIISHATVLWTFNFSDKNECSFISHYDYPTMLRNKKNLCFLRPILFMLSRLFYQIPSVCLVLACHYKPELNALIDLLFFMQCVREGKQLIMLLFEIAELSLVWPSEKRTNKNHHKTKQTNCITRVLVGEQNQTAKEKTKSVVAVRKQRLNNWRNLPCISKRGSMSIKKRLK